jgi:formylglycine-generating enzyme required for sulfatase activity
MLFDSCFSGSIFTLRSEQVPPIIDDKIQSKVRQYITSGGEDESVPDKSYFKTCLLQGLDGYADLNKDNYVTGIELGSYLKDNVVNYSNKTQHPQYGTINDPKLDKGDFVFAMNTKVEPLAPIISNLKPTPQVTVVAEPTTGSIKVDSNREGEIYLDGKSMLIISIDQKKTFDNIKPGNHNLELRYSGKTESKTLTVYKNQTTQVTFKIIAPPPAGMVYVEGGTFTMGDTAGRGESYEKPNHQVTLSSFYMGKHEVTQKQWQEVMGNKPAHFKGDNLPVEQVSWYDCVEFCNKLSQNEGLTPCYSGSGKQTNCDWTANGYRLPTEAEWEYAAKGGKLSKGFKYYGSNDIENVAWYDNNSVKKTHAVGGRQANELGIFDMNGNVYEWCWDWYDNYTSNNQTNPHGSNNGINRVLRGGSWNVDGYNCRAANKQGSPGERDSDIGMRFIRIAQ